MYTTLTHSLDALRALDQLLTACVGAVCTDQECLPQYAVELDFDCAEQHCRLVRPKRAFERSRSFSRSQRIATGVYVYLPG
jgi:hypothetical protein